MSAVRSSHHVGALLQPVAVLARRFVVARVRTKRSLAVLHVVEIVARVPVVCVCTCVCACVCVCVRARAIVCVCACITLI